MEWVIEFREYAGVAHVAAKPVATAASSGEVHREADDQSRFAVYKVADVVQVGDWSWVVIGSESSVLQSRVQRVTPEPLKAMVDEASSQAGEVLAGAKILIVEDDVSLGKFLSRALRQHHFAVEISLDGEAAWQALRGSRYDLVILDLNLPHIDGIELLQRVRQTQPALRMLVLTARNRTEDLVLALEQGADDCLIKPFSFLELVARVRGLLRRQSSASTSASRVGDLSLDREQHRVMRSGRTIDLTPREFAILECLMNNAGKTISRMTLMRDVWNIPFDPTNNIVDVYMKYLRDKIDLAGEVKLLHTIRGVGYVLRDE